MLSLKKPKSLHFEGKQLHALRFKNVSLELKDLYIYWLSMMGQISRKFLPPGVNVIKLFNKVIYSHFKVMLSFCVKMHYYLGNYCKEAVNYCGIFVTNVIKHDLT